MTVAEEPTPDVQLPAGWSVSGYQDTTQTTAGNQVVQGIKFLLSGPGGGSTSVFIPRSALTNTQAVANEFNKQIGSIQAIVNLSNPG